MQDNVNSHSLIDNLIRSRRPGFALPFTVEDGEVIDLSLANITYIEETESEQVIAHFHDSTKSTVVLADDMDLCVERLKLFAFIRISQTHLLNLSFLEKIQYFEESCICKLHGGKEIEILEIG